MEGRAIYSGATEQPRPLRNLRPERRCFVPMAASLELRGIVLYALIGVGKEQGPKGGAEVRAFGKDRQGWSRSGRTGAVAVCARLLGIAAVLVNVFAWVLVAIPAASAQESASPAYAFTSEICGHSAPAQDGQTGHPLCPQCFPMGGHCSAAFLPVAADLVFVATAQGRVEERPSTRLTPIVRLFRQHARAPPVLA